MTSHNGRDVWRKPGIAPVCALTAALTVAVTGVRLKAESDNRDDQIATLTTTIAQLALGTPAFISGAKPVWAPHGTQVVFPTSDARKNFGRIQLTFDDSKDNPMDPATVTAVNLEISGLNTSVDGTNSLVGEDYNFNAWQATDGQWQSSIHYEGPHIFDDEGYGPDFSTLSADQYQTAGRQAINAAASILHHDMNPLQKPVP